jgi:hypothetical protein
MIKDTKHINYLETSNGQVAMQSFVSNNMGLNVAPTLLTSKARDLGVVKLPRGGTLN